MNLQNLFPPTDKAVATHPILKDKGAATLLQLKKGAVLSEHQSPTKALLILLSGKAVYEEAQRKEILSQSQDFVHIPAKITHKLTGIEDSLLLLVK